MNESSKRENIKRRDDEKNMLKSKKPVTSGQIAKCINIAIKNNCVVDSMYDGVRFVIPLNKLKQITDKKASLMGFMLLRYYGDDIKREFMDHGITPDLNLSRMEFDFWVKNEFIDEFLARDLLKRFISDIDNLFKVAFDI